MGFWPYNEKQIKKHLFIRRCAMKTKISCVTLYVLMVLTIIGTIKVIEAQGAESDYYYVDNRKMSLSVSENYKAIALKPGISPANRQGFESTVKAAGVGDIEKSPILEKHGIVLIRSKKQVGPSAFRSGMAPLMTRAEVRSEVPVYSIGKTNAVLINEFIVQFKSDISQSQINEFIRAVNAKVVKKYKKIKNRYILTFEGKTPKEALAISNRIHQDNRVTFSEPNFIQIIPARPKIQSSGPGPSAPSPATTTPNDPLFSQQWGLNNTGGVGVADADIDAPEAWDHERGSDQVIIAILDEGVDIQHPDLQTKIVTPYDATDGDDDQTPNSWDGHGTACAGIAAAITANGLGVAGVAWDVRILPVRIAFSNCDVCDWVTSAAIIEDGLRTAVDRGAHVLSNSWGGGLPSNAITSGIDYAISNDRVVVFAAGNDAGPVSYPGDLSSSRTIITVSATNEWDEFKTTTSQDGETWWGSNFGPEINIAAPGVHIYTTDIHGTDGYVNGDYVPNFNGTSSATPFVAGAAALLLSQNRSLSPAQIRDRLQRCADDLGASGFDNQFGHGRLNVACALNGITLTVDLVLDPDIELEEGQTTTARATVTSAGVPQNGKTVNFSTTETSLASVSSTTAVTNPRGEAEVTVRGESQYKSTTTLLATANGGHDTVTVRVPDLSPAGVFLLMACLLLVVLLRRQNARE
jgi:subtilisin family serine protease